MTLGRRLLLGLTGTCAAAAATHAQTPAARYALLVGVSEYPRLDVSGPRYRLEGPPNDVALMRRVLEGEPFKFEPARITSLAGWPTNPDLRPTKANIKRAFERITAQVKNGDQVFVLMAGHGSQQPADDDPNDVEPDGLDEIFLPADAAGWKGEIGQVENAIVDDEVRVWVNDLRAKGAFVWIVFDSCHSGTMVRGAPSSVERERQIPVDTLIPKDVLDRARAKSTGTRGSASDAPLLGLAEGAGELAALYAAQMGETTPEKRLPDAKGQVHGLFTYTLADILATSSSPLTYRELANRVLEHYRAMQRGGPTPTFEGAGLDREVLGQRTFPDRPQLLLGGPVESGIELRAGSIHGLTPGSILEVYPPAGSSAGDRPLGHVTVVSAKAGTSIVTPVAHNNMPAPAADRLVDGARARVVEYDYGDSRLRIALQGRVTTRGGDEFEVVRAGAGPAPLERAAGTLSAGSQGLAVRTDSAEDAEWFVRTVGEDVVLVPASGWTRDASKEGAAASVPPQFRIGSVNSPDLATNLSQAAQRIARSRTLMHLAEGPAPAGDVNLELKLVRYPNDTSTAGRELTYEPGGPRLVVGEWVAFQMTNKGTVPLDVTLLFIDSSYGIQALYPTVDQEIDNRIQPGQQGHSQRFEVVATTLGIEQVVAIGVPGGVGPRTSFAMLAQPSLDALKTRSGTRSPLMDLLERSMYGGQTRSGSGSLRIGGGLRHVVRMISWQTVAR
jgi:hypothetical protein